MDLLTTIIAVNDRYVVGGVSLSNIGNTSGKTFYFRTLQFAPTKAHIKPIGAFTSYQWSNGSIAAQIVIAKPGLYALQVKATNACLGTDSIVASPKDCLAGVFLPNAFTPTRMAKMICLGLLSGPSQQI